MSERERERRGGWKREQVGGRRETREEMRDTRERQTRDKTADLQQ